MKGTKNFNRLLKEHLRISRIVSKHFLKTGKAETSTVIEHKVIIIDGESKLRSEITLLPYRRMYTHGGEKQSNPHLYYEMEEDIEV